MKSKINFLKSILLIGIVAICFSSCSKDEDFPSPKASIELVSGNNQTGNGGMQLNEQILIKIKDKDGNSFSNFPIDLIHLEVVEGAVFFASSVADSDGLIFINWNLGSSLGIQTLTISGTHNSSELENSPITVKALAQP